MPRSKAPEAPRMMAHPFTYTPGDHRRYVWMDGQEAIVVERIGRGIGDRPTFTPTGDTIPLPATRSASAMMAAVDGWRAR